MFQVTASLSIVTALAALSNRLTPLKSFDAVLVTYDASWPYSELYRERSVSVFVTSCAETASSLIRLSALPTCCRKPSWVWV